MRDKLEDRRVRRTQKQIEEALIKLLAKKNIQNITVKELAEEADITRSTFYQHYSSPYILLKDMQQEIMNNIQSIINETTGGDAFGFFKRLFEYFMEEDVRAEVLSFDSGEGTGFEFIGNSIHKNYMLRWGQQFSAEQSKQYEYYRYYIVFGCVAVVDSWMRNGKKEGPEEMAKIVNSLLPKEKMYLKQDK